MEAEQSNPITEKESQEEIYYAQKGNKKKIS